MPNWLSGGTSIKKVKGQEIHPLTSMHDFCQLINKPTLLTKESSSCIDIIFAKCQN